MKLPELSPDKLLNLRTFMMFNLVVFLAKVAYSFALDFPGGYFEDWHIAKNLVEHGIYSEFINVGPTAYKLPVYPLFISLFMLAFPAFPFEALVTVQHIIYFFIPFLLIRISGIFRKEKAGVLTAYFFIFSPVYFYYSNVAEVTNIFVPIFLIWLYQYFKIYIGHKFYRPDFILLGFISAALFLTQVVAVPMVIFLLLYLYLRNKIRFSALAFILFTISVFYSPWIIRNHIVFDKIILTKTPFWHNVYFGFVPQVNIIKEVQLISEEHERYTSGLRKSVDEFEMEKIFKKETLRVLNGKETVFFKKAIQNAFLLWYVPARYYDEGFTALFGRKFMVLGMNIVTVFALFYFFRFHRRFFYFSILVFFNFTVPYMIGHAANTRFKLDFEWFQYAVISLFIYEKWFRINEEKAIKKVAVQLPENRES
ncbi:hypothetical protein EIZ47_05690 [Chryseobacterium lacus]|uniref:Glycosyltransferase RgtA/B/C/D-like domain-containing protein n=1 Tax=Chryseobacterium lacus TaxID=2058346 RepID=A0A368MXL9_9FLAO|nr:hypothetical protein [Chryseobacterium lacus]RCU42938.1 hypothetical protein DQ356_05740 [Chryseobacterium lacus]RST27790.1 hypothetical protein EIZ47_05690 [Chryseobacterium lacus]